MPSIPRISAPTSARQAPSWLRALPVHRPDRWRDDRAAAAVQVGERAGGELHREQVPRTPCTGGRRAVRAEAASASASGDRDPDTVGAADRVYSKPITPHALGVEDLARQARCLRFQAHVAQASDSGPARDGRSWSQQQAAANASWSPGDRAARTTVTSRCTHAGEVADPPARLHGRRVLPARSVMSCAPRRLPRRTAAAPASSRVRAATARKVAVVDG